MNIEKEVKHFNESTTNSSFVVFDTETTGLSPVDCDIIEFSAIKCKMHDGGYTVEDELDIYINVGYPIPEAVVEITGITDEKLEKDGVSPFDAAKIIHKFIGDNAILAGYNSVSFDEKFMSKLFAQELGEDFAYSMHLDVLKMARLKTPKPHKLIDMCEKFSLTENYKFHTAIEDVKATADVMMRLIPMFDGETSTSLTVTSIKRWTRGTMDRLYVNNEENLSIYYDTVNKYWSIDDEEIVSAVLKFADVKSVEELEQKY